MLKNKTVMQFHKANSGNLPKINTEILMLFFDTNAKHHASEHREIRTVRSNSESYGDDAIGHVEVGRLGNMCIVKAEVTPGQASYKIIITFDEVKEEVMDAVCVGCQKSAGGSCKACKHIFAFLFWLYQRSEESPPTDVVCYWQNPKAASVESGIQYITAADLAEPPQTCEMFDGRKCHDAILAEIRKRKIPTQISPYLVTE